jgi:hypothetical protein
MSRKIYQLKTPKKFEKNEKRERLEETLGKKLSDWEYEEYIRMTVKRNK